ncbi:DUF3592 domain-containing protein [Tengunoibacter tsumagoiensis]|uniref:DUF3592 domain-containing protein n=1 Tax=Tengunoibacter tsumagoiensis TaxID=2014871 RepID=A0A401ZWD7_9CHLR|nr:DUF3592 domain-containing protein [Tengunoibacter tsumagoiensis]GCE11219.1 hypothetical protein KTT_10780 [Tengunoibacter tsumagoiensis]
MYSHKTNSSEEAYTGWPLRPRARPLLTLAEMLILLIAVLIPSCRGFYRAHYYSRFVRGTCTITDGYTMSNKHFDQNGLDYITYVPDLHYTISTSGTSKIASSGYEGPDQASFYEAVDAQAIVNRYPVGTTTTCSYNPVNPQEAFLVFHGYSQERAWKVFWASFIVYGLAQIITLLVWYLWMRKFIILYERGQLTRGRVVRHENRRDIVGHYDISIIEYTGISISNNPIRGEFIVYGHRSLNSSFPVCYDPYRPTRARQGNRPTRTDIIAAIITTLLLLIAISGFIYIFNFPLT